MKELVAENDINFQDIKVSVFQWKLAFLDLKESLLKWKLWSYLGWNDIKMRYRGSILGPFWITASMLIFIGAFSIVYSRLFHQSLSEYVPFLTAGYLVWLMISTVLVESGHTYIEASSLITEIKLPYFLYILRLLWRHTLIFFHNALVFFVVALYFNVPINWHILLVIPGLFLVILNLISLAGILSILGTKYRDIPQLTTSLIQVAFFVTPISWSPTLLNNSLIILCNPLAYFIELVRAPLLGQVPSLRAWVASLLITLIVFSGAFTLFARFRRNIPFWL